MIDDRLLLISGSEQLVLNHTDGQETLAGCSGVFRYIDSNFKNWACDVPGRPTKKTPVRVYEVTRDRLAMRDAANFALTVLWSGIIRVRNSEYAMRLRLATGGWRTVFWRAVAPADREQVMRWAQSKGEVAPARRMVASQRTSRR